MSEFRVQKRRTSNSEGAHVIYVLQERHEVSAGKWSAWADVPVVDERGNVDCYD